jgi:glutathione reductase (NADPH)
VSEGKIYDLAVIGSGTAAQVASFRVRAAGWSVAVIDHLPFGGTCALRGCDPKKMLISGAEAIDMANRMRGSGVSGELGISWPELIAFKRTFTDPVPQKQEQRYAAVGTEDRVRLAHIDVDVRVVLRWGLPDALEFPHSDADFWDTAVVPEL